MITNPLISITIMILSGMACARLLKQLKLPNVTGYLVAGLLIGPSVLGIIPEDIVSSFTLISEVALGFIAFSIGNEFKISYFKQVGVTPIVIAVFESLFAVLFVFAALVAAGYSVPFSLVLGSIAAATAPAATIMVINQYKAKGIVTSTLLSVVAIDDATALFFFSISVAIAQTILNPASVSLASVILAPLWEIGGALVVGALLGFLFNIPLRWFKKDGNRLALVIAFVFAGVGIAGQFGFSSLLLCMALGAVFANLSPELDPVMEIVNGFTPPLFLLFFVCSGAELKLSVLSSVGIIGAIYIIVRVVGKIAGAAFGAAICKADPMVKKYLGFSLIPQAGVAIGLSLVATQVMPEFGAEIRAIILCGTLIYELVGPGVTKFALIKAGEIHEEHAKTPVSNNEELLP